MHSTVYVGYFISIRCDLTVHHVGSNSRPTSLPSVIMQEWIPENETKSKICGSTVIRTSYVTSALKCIIHNIMYANTARLKHCGICINKTWTVNRSTNLCYWSERQCKKESGS